MSNITVQEYLDMESDSAPYKTKWDLSLSDIKVGCPKCKKDVQDVKTKFVEYEHVVVILGYGVCNDCKTVVSSKPMRVYDDGRTMWKNNEGEWITGHMKKITLFDKFIGMLGKALGKAT